jgi:DNA-binding IclR family transcriptional regulator
MASQGQPSVPEPGSPTPRDRKSAAEPAHYHSGMPAATSLERPDPAPSRTADAPGLADASDTSGVAVLDRAFALLKAFDAEAEKLSLTELSRRTGLYKSTVLRLLAALEHGGFVRRLPEGQYAVGPEPLRLATLYQRSFDVGHVIQPMLERLSAASGETASFYVRQGAMRIALFRVEPSRSIRASVRPGQGYPIHQGASGKVLLAFSADAGGAHADVRGECFASSFGERDPETASVAAPVFGVHGELLGALALSAPIARLADPAALGRARAALLEAAREATATLGGRPAAYRAGTPA